MLIAQQQTVLSNSVFIRISNNAQVVLDNPNANALQVSNTGNVISEGENNALKWLVGSSTGTFAVPFATNSLVTIPLQCIVTTPGSGANSAIMFSTYETTNDDNTAYPSDVTNMNSNCNSNNGLYAVDRFWRIDAQSYSTKPFATITFGYDNAANEIAGTNSITESKLKAQRFNSSINAWETPQKLFGLANSSLKNVSAANINPADFFKTWTLIDTSSMNLPILLTSLNNSTLCAGSPIVISPNGATNYTLVPTTITTTTNFTVMPSGTITYTIIGSVGSGTAVCISDITNSPTVSVSVNALPIISASVTNVLCYGGNTGSAIALVSGNATYTWSNGSHASILNGLAAGNYVVTVQDDNVCVATKTISVTQPNMPLTILTANNFHDVLCNGQSTGYAEIGVIGGTANYTYTWQPNGILSNTLANVPAGSYTVFVTDANNCKDNRVFPITEPLPLKVFIADSVKATCNEQNGALVANTSGGAISYNYQWFPTNSNASALQNISSGNYTVIVTDGNGCKDSLQVFLGCESPIVIPQLFTPNADGKNDVFYIKGLERFPYNVVSVYNRWGSLVYAQSPYQNNWNGKALSANHIGNGLLPAATYFVVIDFGEQSLLKPYSGYVELRY